MNMLLNANQSESLTDPAIRRGIIADPRQYAIDNGFITADQTDVEVKVVASDRHTIHLPVAKADAFEVLDDAQMQNIQAAGGKVSSAGTAGSASSLSTIGSTYGCASTASSAGTAGSVDVGGDG